MQDLIQTFVVILDLERIACAQPCFLGTDMVTNFKTLCFLTCPEDLLVISSYFSGPQDFDFKGTGV